jgi:hypothetical protein
MLPDPNHSPPALSQFIEVPSISATILVYFVFPILRETAAPSREPIPVPKISVNEHRQFRLAKYNIGTARQCPNILSET